MTAKREMTSSVFGPTSGQNPPPVRTVYLARLCGTGGELDMISADTLEKLQRDLGKRLLQRDWVLAEDDVIRIEEGETKLPRG